MKWKRKWKYFTKKVKGYWKWYRLTAIVTLVSMINLSCSFQSPAVSVEKGETKPEAVVIEVKTEPSSITVETNDTYYAVPRVEIGSLEINTNQVQETNEALVIPESLRSRAMNTLSQPRLINGEVVVFDLPTNTSEFDRTLNERIAEHITAAVGKDT
ncbi:hypothetical protein [Thermospira aquatica]|uniref:Uncharacterized protein n=1 Tax=Thermospira aquatica TaxID=2828656 RepID=A0AAX3BEX5_9SPIR|nr:hypothetical protein [Thermospira aquatica]URA10889.1 hypothetical protein KDW03_03545 [Thermospira aquatica]